MERFDCRNNRLAWLGLPQEGFMVAVAEAKQRYGAHRVAVVWGRSSAGRANATGARSAGNIGA